jgi:hypothetical protein
VHHVARPKHSAGTFSEFHETSGLKTGRPMKNVLFSRVNGQHNFDMNHGFSVCKVIKDNDELVSAMASSSIGTKLPCSAARVKMKHNLNGVIFRWCWPAV